MKKYLKFSQRHISKDQRHISKAKFSADTEAHTVGGTVGKEGTGRGSSAHSLRNASCNLQQQQQRQRQWQQQ